MSKLPEKSIQVYCGELCQSALCSPNEINLINYPINGLEPNITIGYERFVSDPNALPNRVLDLLQIAAVVFCADRMASRGDRESISNQAWARSFLFHISVLDCDFWNEEKVKRALTNALKFMTGDRKYDFDFVKTKNGHIKEKEIRQLSLFSGESARVPDADDYDVMLFSGGLDSLAGILEELLIKERKVIAVSHKSNNAVMNLQSGLINRLNKDYDGRIIPYGFSCHNRKIASREETQRTRMFLFSAIAFTICQCFGKHQFFVYENGVTSLNFPIQMDVINARSSRTTHPKTLGLLLDFYKLFDESFNIIAPYYRKTKEDVVRLFSYVDRKDLIASAVSCSSTRNKRSVCAHCGCCSQCIDRRFALYAAGLHELDTEYAEDFVYKIEGRETSQRLYQQMRFASGRDYLTETDMLKCFGSEVNDAIEFWPSDNSEDSLQEIHELLLRYSDSVLRAVKQMQLKYEDLRKPISEDSFLRIVSDREYLKTPFERRVEEVDERLKRSIPKLFKTEKPKNENDFNNKLVALLGSCNEKWMREYPVISFGLTSYIADASYNGLIIESKYIRGKTSPSTATQGIAADITQVGSTQEIFFVVYDPERQITDDDTFCNSLMGGKTNCIVRIYR